MAKPRIAREGEVLTGQFQGKKASDDEERFLTRAQRYGKVWFKFVLGQRYMPGWLELDALVRTSVGWRTFEIDDMTFIHKGIRERSEAVIKDKRRLDMLADLGVMPYKQRIEHVDAAKLQNPEQSDRTVRSLFR